VRELGNNKLEWKVQIRYKDSEAELCGGGAEKKRIAAEKAKQPAEAQN